MQVGLQTIDWIIILAYIAMSIGIGMYMSRKGLSSPEQYFKSGGGTKWWLLGTSMVATTFAADTPLALAGFVVTTGISKNWFWWCQVPITMAGVFFFARLWKRANPLTDMEFVFTRYSGNSAKALRGFKALWLAIPYSCLILGWVNKAMTKVIVLCVPDFPRIPVVDTVMMMIFMATPLSQDVDPAVKSAYHKGQIKPLDIAADYQLMKYENFQIFQEVKNGVYSERKNAALDRLGLSKQGVEPDSLKDIRGVPRHLYEKPATAQAGIQSGSAGLVRPVQLADGNWVEYEALLNSGNLRDDRIFQAGERELKIAQGEASEEQAPMAAMGSLVFMQSIYSIASGVLTYKVLFLLFLITVCYTAISGLWGVLVTDFVQFWIAMAGCIYLAFAAVAACGGMEEMLTRMTGIYGLAKTRAMVSVLPTTEASGIGLMPFKEFLIFIMIVWWSLGFTDGGSYLAQRMLSAKDERHATLGYLWYGVAHYALRMWPWLIVGFAAAVLFPYVPYPTAEGKNSEPPGSHKPMPGPTAECPPSDR